MAETFFIKKTAFDDTSNNISERESNSFIIGPGELNGPGGISRKSDLRLYGSGSAKWGEGVDQNIFRLLENHACPRKVVGDPGYDVNNPKPKDEGDLGIGNGITVPVVGQPWFDTSSNKLFVYKVTGVWSSVSVSDLETDGSLDMNNKTIHGVANPVDGTDAVNLNYADARYVNISGDTMTGTLVMSAGDINMSNNKITTLGNATAAGDAVSQGFADSRYIRTIGGTTTGNITFSSGADIVMSAGSDISMSGTGKITGLDTAVPTSAGDVISRGRGDSRYLALNGSNIMTGNLLMGANKITNLQNPSSTQDAATKSYVDTATAAAVTYTSIITQDINASSTTINLPAGTWHIEAHARFHIVIIAAARLRIDGTIVDNLTGGSFVNYDGTNFIPLFGVKSVSGNQTITVNFTADFAFDFPRIMIKAVRTG